MIINDKESALVFLDALKGESLETVHRYVSRAIEAQLVCIGLCRDNMRETKARHRDAVSVLQGALVFGSKEHT